MSRNDRADEELLGEMFPDEKREINPDEEYWGDIKIVTWNLLNKKEFPEAKWRIKNLVPMEGFVLLASVSGDRKTWMTLEMCRAIVKGIPFLGEFETIEGSVLYLDGEMSKSELQRRGRQLGLSDGEMGKIWILDNSDLNLNEAHGVDDLIGLIKKKGITTIIVDTFRSFAGGIREEKAEEVRTFYNRFKPLKDSGIACIFLDHMRKPNRFEGSTPKKESAFGSQDKVASVEVLLMIQTDQKTEKINVYQFKNRLGKELSPFCVNMIDEVSDTEKITTKLEYAGELEEDEVKKERAKELILTILEGGSRTQQEIIEINQREYDIGSKNTRLALSEMTLNRLINKEKDGRKNLYSLKKRKRPKKTLFGRVT